MVAGKWHLHPVIGCMAMEGSLDGSGERFITVSAENPTLTPGFTAGVQLKKAHLEAVHLQNFIADYVLAHGTVPFGNPRPGADPPDFYVSSESSDVGVDCAAFANTHRRMSHHLMASLRERIVVEAGDRDFNGVRGCMISVWFGERLQDLPPKKRDDSLVGPLLDAISSCSVDFQAVSDLIGQIAADGFPQVMPPVIETRTVADGAAGFVVNVLAGPAEGVQFSNGLPFDLQLARQADATASGVTAELQRIVTSHDKPEINVLVVTAGGPSRDGMQYPAEEVMAAFFLGLDQPRLEAAHLGELHLHLWGSRSVAKVELVRAMPPLHVN